MRSVISLVVAVSFFLTTLPLPAQQATPAEKPFIAVLDFQVSGGDLPKDIGTTVADKIREVLAGTGKYRIVNRGDIEKIMAEIRFSQSGLCDQSCELEVAKQLSAQLIITGRITKLSAKECKIFAQLTDVTTGEILKPASDTGGCDTASIESGAENVAMDLAGIARQPGKMIIQSNPAGAMISIDGERVGPTPLNIPLKPGNHKINAYLKGYDPQDQSVSVLAGSTATIKFSLKKLKKKWYQTWWFYTVVGAVVLGGGGAAAMGMGGGGGGGGGGATPTGSLNLSW
jgi:hypothetical protein